MRTAVLLIVAAMVGWLGWLAVDGGGQVGAMSQFAVFIALFIWSAKCIDRSLSHDDREYWRAKEAQADEILYTLRPEHGERIDYEATATLGDWGWEYFMRKLGRGYDIMDDGTSWVVVRRDMTAPIGLLRGQPERRAAGIATQYEAERTDHT